MMQDKDVIILEVKPQFELGKVVVTVGVDTLMKNDIYFQRFVRMSLGKYTQCDWGDTCAEDKTSNNEALKDGKRIFAVYIYKKTNTKIWIITEWDRSITTILFPHEY